jgi:hypothetical protein
MAIENWLPVVGYEGLYEVSDQGRVRSIDRPNPYRRWGENGMRLMRGRVLVQAPSSDGKYLCVHLSANNKQKTHKVDHLVLTAYVGPRPDGLDSCHWDDDGHNNRLTNLRWDTRANNHHDCVRNGRHYQASKTFCPQRHEYTPENTVLLKGGGRRCRTCARKASRDYMRRKRAAA